VSKAFTRESDGAGDDSPPPPRPQLPPGVTNYITAAGAQRLRDELLEVSERKRQLASTNPELCAQAELRKLQARIRQIQAILESVTIAQPAASAQEKIRFGATVTVRNSKGDEETYQIVGLDEAEPDSGRISWLSPLARQLMNRRPGERIRFRSPSGEEDLLIISVV
jgi:transcription elongation factor GreB